MRKKTIIIWSIIILIIMGIIVYFLWDFGIFLLNNPSKEKYPIRGVDVSSYQGDIDWNVLASQDIQFAFIKATEGSSFVDEKFQENYENAIQTNLKIGAYHFFSYDSEGVTQAENFIKTVPKMADLLPPVIDIEFYGDKRKHLPDVEETQKQLQIMLDCLEEYYGKKPILYAVHKSYELYIENTFTDYPIWIRDVFFCPDSKKNIHWTFWQYTDKARLKGYEGPEKRIDMNVFHGTKQEWNLLSSTTMEESEEDMKINVKINDTNLTATLEDNSSSRALMEKLKEGPLTIHMQDYANFEKVGALGFDLPTNDVKITTKPGDMILYQGNQLTIYYDTNTWNFTKLGEINDITQEKLKDILGKEDVTIEISLLNI